MKSVYDELADKLKAGPSVSARQGPRQDLGILLFSQREALRELWIAADAAGPSMPALREAVERLRPFFGERP